MNWIDESVALQKIVRLLEQLIKNQKTGKRHRTWVRASIIQAITGWDITFLVMAREDGVVKFKKDGRNYLYLLESIPEKFLK